MPSSRFRSWERLTSKIRASPLTSGYKMWKSDKIQNTKYIWRIQWYCGMGLVGFRCHTNANHLIQDKVYILENIYKSVITNNVRSFHIGSITARAWSESGVRISRSAIPWPGYHRRVCQARSEAPPRISWMDLAFMIWGICKETRVLHLPGHDRGQIRLVEAAFNLY